MTDLCYSTNHLLQLSPWRVSAPQLNTLLAGVTTRYVQGWLWAQVWWGGDWDDEYRSSGQSRPINSSEQLSGPNKCGMWSMHRGLLIGIESTDLSIW